jgi:hypothetical protein
MRLYSQYFDGFKKLGHTSSMNMKRPNLLCSDSLQNKLTHF